MQTPSRNLMKEVQLFNIIVSMAIILLVAAVSAAIMAASMLGDLRRRSVETADELAAFLEYPLYSVDGPQAVRIAETFLSSGRISGIMLESTSDGRLLDKKQRTHSSWIPQISRQLQWQGLPLGQFTLSFSDEEVMRTLARFAVISLAIIFAVFFANMAANRLFLARKVRQPFETIVAAMETVASGNYTTTIEPTAYRDVNVLVSHFNEMARRIHQKNRQQKKTEAALREGRQLLESTFASMRDAIFVLNAGSDKIMQCNPAAAKIFGYHRDRMVGRTMDFLHVDPASADAFKNSMAAAFGHNDHFSLPEFPMKRQDETVIATEHTVMPLKDDQGVRLGWLRVIRDISERKQMEHEKANLQHQLLQLQKMEAIGTLAGGIAHDFNNILAGIIGYAELAEENAPAGDDCLRKYLTRILEAGNRARNLVGQILSFSRQGKNQQQVLGLTPLVKECVKLLESLLPKTITLKLLAGAEEDAVLADPTQIHQVIMNIGTNAYHAMRKTGGCLTFRLENVHMNHSRSRQGFSVAPGTYIKLSVTDTGPGIPPDIVSRVFDPYFTTKDVNEGTGLGLSVSHGIVKNHKGLLEIEETSASGTTFAVFLPISCQQGSDGKPGKRHLIPGENQHILAVDDEAFFLDVLYEGLTALGYRVTTVQSGAEALEHLRENPHAFDLLITDQTMPGMTGIQLAAEVLKIYPALPIILCTGYSENINEDTAAGFGIDRFLWKPVSREDLSQSIYDVLRSRKQ